MIPLRPGQYSRLLTLLKAVPFNVYFARAVLEDHIEGAVYADTIRDPRAAYILHPCGMSLLCGAVGLEPFTSQLVRYLLDADQKRKRPELAQVFPQTWKEVLVERLGERLLLRGDPRREGLGPEGLRDLGRRSVLEWGRINYKFERSLFEAIREPALPAELRLERAGREVFHPWEGPVMPSSFWASPEEFERKGTAFAIYQGDRPLCVAFSAWEFSDALEIGIETHPEARKRGLASLACAALIRHALSRGLEPVWSVHSENKASQALAVRLGFRQTVQVPYFRLVEKGA